MRAQIRGLDADARWVRSLDGSEYMPGLVGLNNMKANDYVNVVVQAGSLPLKSRLIVIAALCTSQDRSNACFPCSFCSDPQQMGCDSEPAEGAGWSGTLPDQAPSMRLRAGAGAGGAAAGLLPAAGQLRVLHLTAGAALRRAAAQDLEPAQLQGPGAHTLCVRYAA